MVNSTQASKPTEEIYFEDNFCCDACAASGITNTATYSLGAEVRGDQPGHQADKFAKPIWHNICETHYTELSDDQRELYARLAGYEPPVGSDMVIQITEW